MTPTRYPPHFTAIRQQIASRQETWLITGAAGFIGSNLTEALLRLGQRVVGLDNFSMGSRARLADVQAQLTPEEWSRFTLIEGDITDLETCRRATAGVTRILHQAALGSVPRSIKDPIGSHRANVDGFLHMLHAAQEAQVERFVYASSSSVYGDSPELPKIEGAEGNVLSPYAATKLMDEIYAEVFHRCYQTPAIGLRYFNVFGRRQDPNGAYAAVIPKWVAAMLTGDTCTINGDGETSRDFCYIENVIQANLLAATAPAQACGRAYNIACGARMTLTELHAQMRANLPGLSEAARQIPPVYVDFRPGDIRHSHADISAARTAFGYDPVYQARDGLRDTLAWYAAYFHATQLNQSTAP